MYINDLIVYLNTEHPRKAMKLVSECYLYVTRIQNQAVSCSSVYLLTRV